jgi:hypothetical protein
LKFHNFTELDYDPEESGKIHPSHRSFPPGGKSI